MLQMNQVTSELRLARSVIAERDTEIQKLLTTNKQVRFIQTNVLTDALLTPCLLQLFFHIDYP